MIIHSPKPEVSNLVDRDPVKTSFKEWAKPGHFSRTIAKGPGTTTWIWNLHTDAHNFDSHTSDLEEISRKVFSAHLGQLSIIFLWLSGMYFHDACFSNYKVWLSDPTHIGPSAQGETPFFTLNWSKYADFLTFRGGLDPVTGGLWLTDIAHHHLAIAIFFLIAGHMYKTNWGISHGLKDILEAHKGPFTGQGHKGLYEILTTSWHAQLSLNLAMLGSLTIVVAHHMYSMPPYPYLATDYDKANLGFYFPCDGPGRGGTCQVQNPLHVRPIAHTIWDPHFGQPVMEAFTRGGALGPVNIAYFGVYQWWYTIGLCTNQDLYIGSLFLLFLSAISLIAGLFGVSSLAWTGHLVHVSIPASRGEYVWWNNFLDVLLHPQGLGPLFTGQWNLYAQNPDSSSHLFGPGDFLVHDAIALSLHTTTLILVKGALYARGSKLMPDKKDFDYSFPCDGPGLGGTYDISAMEL
ncbi:Photosystem I chlorophyll a apoprotein A1 [Capsicum baccatum]|uniref:photosystem I n=1 Tax=Capsicum baccatum TaxID=33114 RepID=A0A2G2XBF2_CAPBA|nr:Photosystem I chlorophyll a apoprotein A1 [Capsicum baccatum]